jgi:hypothetical protein
VATTVYVWLLAFVVVITLLLYFGGSSLLTVIGITPSALVPNIAIVPTTFSKSNNRELTYKGSGFNPDSAISIWLTGGAMAVDSPTASTNSVQLPATPNTQMLSIQPASDSKGDFTLTIQYPGGGVTDYYIATADNGDTVLVKASDGKNVANTSFKVTN